MRRTYPRSDETFKVLSGHEPGISRQMECDISYINKIKNGVEPDRYPPFREIFRAACNDGAAPAEIWLNDMIGIYTRSRKANINASELSGKLLEKIQTDGEALTEIVKSLADNHLDKNECHKILAAIARNNETNKNIEAAVYARLGELSEAETTKPFSVLRPNR